jgi:hypothetical protein
LFGEKKKKKKGGKKAQQKKLEETKKVIDVKDSKTVSESQTKLEKKDSKP